MSETMESEVLGRSYQEHLVVRLTEEGFISKVAGVLTPEVFDADLSPVVRFALGVYAKHKKPPSLAQIKQGIKGVRLTLASGPVDFDIDEITNFCRIRSLRGDLLSAVQKLEDGDLPAARGIISQCASSKGHNTRYAPVSLLDYDPESLHGMGRKKPCYTGLPLLDEYMKGVCAGEIAAVMAVSNGGKSSWLVHVGGHSILEGKNVFHASFEMPEATMRAKYFERLNLLGASQASLKRKSKKMGESVLFCAPPSSVTLADVYTQVASLPFSIDVIILDSVENLKCHRAYGERWAEEDQIAQEFKALVEDFECSGWTSFQANRPGYGREIIRMEHVKGSMDKPRLMDHVISLNQDEMEIQPDPVTRRSQVRIHISKNRYGPKGMTLKTDVDFACSTFHPVEV